MPPFTIDRMDSDITWLRSVQTSGYGLIPNVLSKGETLSLLREIENAGLPRSRAGVRHAMKHPSIARIANDVSMMRIANAILGDGAIPFRATLFEKLPDSNWLVAWHQDTALPLRRREGTSGWGPWSVKDGVTYAHAPARALEQVVALRLHLDDSTAQNGPLRVLPGTQTLGVLTDDEIHSLSETTEAIDCLMPLGGIVAMSPLVIHASSKSQTDLPRRVLHIEYASSSQPADKLELAIA
jgi:ectoine hydroxylase-related dioxygenase (phytanoyl-CoA dioxygenase family)